MLFYAAGRAISSYLQLLGATRVSFPGCTGLPSRSHWPRHHRAMFCAIDTPLRSWCMWCRDTSTARHLATMFDMMRSWGTGHHSYVLTLPSSHRCG